MVVEVLGVGRYVVHDNVRASVDALLAVAEHKSSVPAATISHRTCAADGRMFVRFEPLGGGGRGKQAPTRSFDEWRWFGRPRLDTGLSAKSELSFLNSSPSTQNEFSFANHMRRSRMLQKRATTQIKIYIIFKNFQKFSKTFKFWKILLVELSDSCR